MLSVHRLRYLSHHFKHQVTPYTHAREDLGMYKVWLRHRNPSLRKGKGLTDRYRRLIERALVAAAGRRPPGLRAAVDAEDERMTIEIGIRH